MKLLDVVIRLGDAIEIAPKFRMASGLLRKVSGVENRNFRSGNTSLRKKARENRLGNQLP